MTINNEKNGTDMKIMIEGRLDTTTAPELEKYVEDNIGDTKDLTFDLEKLEYVSSAGLRVLLSTQKKMNKVGSMTIINANDVIMEIFEVTGFSDIMTIR